MARERPQPGGGQELKGEGRWPKERVRSSGALCDDDVQRYGETVPVRMRHFGGIKVEG